MVLKTFNLESTTTDPALLKGDPHGLAGFLRDVVKFAKPERILDPTAGSGVTADVADEALIPCVTSDLHSAMGGVDLFQRDEPDTYDLVVYHPDLWCARPDADHPHDLGATMSWDAYLALNRDALLHLGTQLRDGGRLLLIAPVARRHGKVRYLARDLACLIGTPKEPELVHAHPDCRSTGTMWGKKFIPISHDQVLVYSKDELMAAFETVGDETDAE